MKRLQCLVTLALICSASTAFAQSIEDRIAACAKVSGSQHRLACFETLAADVAGQVEPEADDAMTGSPPYSTSGSESSSQSTEDKFGLEHKSKNEGLADELRAQVSEIYKDGLGKMLLILNNGQIWQQKDTKTLIIHKGDAVRIERGFMSAFYLTANDRKRISVARVK